MNPSSHPYYPQGLILENYAPNTRSAKELIGAWLIALSAIVLSTFAWLALKKLTLTERLISLWFITCGCIHIIFEGHFVLNHQALASLSDFISQEWKEYAKSDSRYLHSDPFIIAIETITAFIWGPLCLYTAIATAHRFPSRHVCVALVSFAHIYGNALYYGTTVIQGCLDSRPEFLYFWVYFIGLNGLHHLPFWPVRFGRSPQQLKSTTEKRRTRRIASPPSLSTCANRMFHE